MKAYLLTIGLCTLLLLSCSVSPQEINYGSDQCSFCRMNIVDKTHASQVVTSKGKQYKYDAIECLIHHIQDEEIAHTPLSYVLVANYNAPGTMIAAENAHFLISKNIPSPMGAYLSAFENKQEAQTAQQKNEGELFDWNTIKAKMQITNE